MRDSPWKDCLACKNKCCKWDISRELFLTPEERKQLKGINTRFPCMFFNKKELCDIHDKRPFDCRFFPFDVHEIGGKFFWIIWKVACPIVKHNTDGYETYLREHEKNLIPKFKKFLGEYSKFRLEEFMNNYEYELLRKIKM